MGQGDFFFRGGGIYGVHTEHHLGKCDEDLKYEDWP